VDYQGIIITGTRCAGKSTIVKRICTLHNEFQKVKAVTTRNPRDDDEDNDYNYVSKKEFDQLDLMIKTEYGEHSYGIENSEVERVIQQNKIPILIITPEYASVFDDFSLTKRIFMTFFLDASDTFLNNRLISRATKNGKISDTDKNEIISSNEKQREHDRKYKSNSLYAILNDKEKDDIVELIISLWEYRNTGGMLPKRIIKLMIKSGLLLEDADTKNISGASYDLSLGKEYAQEGIKTLDEKNAFIEIEPGDYALVSSKEIANFPRDIAARFDLTVSLFCKGVILSNGPQVDPGFKGGLFCLLFNTSNKKIQLKMNEHYATIEFTKLLEPTEAYQGIYQDKTKLMNYLSNQMENSAIKKIRKRIWRLEKIQVFEKYLPIILAILSIVIVVALSLFVYLNGE
jgi:deoxycytidine triphosphate deaminase